MKCLSKYNTTPEMWHKLGKVKMTTAQFNSNFPIVGYWIVDGGIIVYRECGLDSLKELRTGRRQKVTHLSARSLSRLAILALSTPVKFKSLITLTYGANFVSDGGKVKYHLNYLLTKLKRSYGPFEYLWFLEFQRRGAPHFHILVTLPAPKVSDRLKFAGMWADIVEPANWPYMAIAFEKGKTVYVGERKTNGAVVLVHSHPKAWQAIKRQDGARRYVTKYALKLQQKTVPRAYRNVGRFWGKAKG